MVSVNDENSNETSREELEENYDSNLKVKIDVSEGEDNSGEQNVFSTSLSTQETLLCATQKLLSHFGMAFSIGAIRDLPEKVGEVFDPLASVSAMIHVGFNASYGEFPLKKMTIKHFPSIGFTLNGEAIFISAIDDAGMYIINRFDENNFIIEEKYEFLSLKRKLKPILL